MRSTLAVLIVLALCGCVEMVEVLNHPGPMGAGEFYWHLSTQSTRLKTLESVERLNDGSCVKFRSYFVRAYVAQTAHGDVEHASADIDAVVHEAGTNAYIVDHFAWHPVGDRGAMQLRVDFTTFLCS